MKTDDNTTGNEEREEEEGRELDSAVNQLYSHS